MDTSNQHPLHGYVEKMEQHPASLDHIEDDAASSMCANTGDELHSRPNQQQELKQQTSEQSFAGSCPSPAKIDTGELSRDSWIAASAGNRRQEEQDRNDSTAAAANSGVHRWRRSDGANDAGTGSNIAGDADSEEDEDDSDEDSDDDAISNKGRGRGPSWTPEQERLLMQLYEQHRKKWRKIYKLFNSDALNAGLEKRSKEAIKQKYSKMIQRKIQLEGKDKNTKRKKKGRSNIYRQTDSATKQSGHQKDESEQHIYSNSRNGRSAGETSIRAAGDLLKTGRDIETFDEEAHSLPINTPPPSSLFIPGMNGSHQPILANISISSSSRPSADEVDAPHKNEAQLLPVLSAYRQQDHQVDPVSSSSSSCSSEAVGTIHPCSTREIPSTKTASSSSSSIMTQGTKPSSTVPISAAATSSASLSSVAPSASAPSTTSSSSSPSNSPTLLHLIHEDSPFLRSHSLDGPNRRRDVIAAGSSKFPRSYSLRYRDVDNEDIVTSVLVQSSQDDPLTVLQDLMSSGLEPGLDWLQQQLTIIDGFSHDNMRTITRGLLVFSIPLEGGNGSSQRVGRLQDIPDKSIVAVELSSKAKKQLAEKVNQSRVGKQTTLTNTSMAEHEKKENEGSQREMQYNHKRQKTSSMTG